VTNDGQAAPGGRRDTGGLASRVVASLATVAAAAGVVALLTSAPPTDERAHFTDSVLAPLVADPDTGGRPG
jgi:hypothetical protein